MYRAEYIFPFAALLAGLLFSIGASQVLAAETTLTLVKQVVNDDGGLDNANTDPALWLLIAEGIADPFFFFYDYGPVVSSVVPPGVYKLLTDENNPAGYTDRWECDGGNFISPDHIEIADGEQITCTNISDDIAPTLKLVKQVVGGSASAHDWQLTVAGERGFTDFGDSAIFHTVKANIVYVLSENGSVDHTQTGPWSCDRGFVQGNTLTLDVGVNATCTITNTYSPPQTLDPVIIIPGILGSWEKNGEWLIDPVFGIYNDLIDTLAANGYTEGQDLFTFPYNWRESNVETANLLEEKIDEVQEICDCQKVDLVAHSMGGLVAREYIQSNYYESDVDQMIFLGTPHLGAPAAYLMWEGGNLELFKIFGFLAKIGFTIEARKNGYPDLFSYIRSAPISSVEELLPIYSYLFEVDGTLRDYPTDYPQNIFLENIENTKNTLHQRTHVKNVIGSVPEGDTITGYTIEQSIFLPKWEHGKPLGDGALFDDGILRGEGDGTVPYISATSVSTDHIAIDVNHSGLPSSAAETVYNILKNKDADVVVENGSNLGSDTLLISLLSPIDMQIIAPDGKRLGKNFDTNTELDEIPDAFYSGFNTDEEYAVIVNPLPGEYKIKTIGTDNGGEYTIVADYIDTEGFVETETSGNTNPAQELETFLTLSTTERTIEIESADQDPPVITITSPQANKTYTRLDTVSITATVADASPIATTTYWFNGKKGNPISPLSFKTTPLGTSTVSVSATDSFGNAATSSIAFRLGATPKSCEADMTRAYQNKWITKKTVRNLLIFDCKALGVLLQKREGLLKNPLKNKAKLAANALGIKVVLAAMELLAKDKGNTKEGVLLILENTKWFKDHELK